MNANAHSSNETGAAKMTSTTEALNAACRAAREAEAEVARLALALEAAEERLHEAKIAERNARSADNARRARDFAAHMAAYRADQLAAQGRTEPAARLGHPRRPQQPMLTQHLYGARYAGTARR